jgi:peptidoglycan/xylan/chitin deacetylase (PgdA/CDA1 family)
MLRTLARRPKRFLKRTASFLMGAAVVLLYHRVYDTDFDPLLLSVSPDNFDAQMTYLRRRYALLSLEELRGALGKGSVPRGAVAITFDDGYGDNLRNARPILDRHRIPATVFVTTGYTGSGREFWWDELGRTLFFAPRVPERLSLSNNGTTREWAMGAAARMTIEERLADRTWTVLRRDDPSELHRAYREIQPILSLAPSEQRDQMLMDLRGQTSNGAADLLEDSEWADPVHDSVAMTREELRSLATGGLITIGAHTVTHPVLSALTPEVAAHEIRRSKLDLQEILGAPVTSFAYPYGYRGAYTAQNVADVRAAGLADAYSNFGGAVRPHANPYELNRILVRNWSLDEFGRVVRQSFGD